MNGQQEFGFIPNSFFVFSNKHIDDIVTGGYSIKRYIRRKDKEMIIKLYQVNKEKDVHKVMFESLEDTFTKLNSSAVDSSIYDLVYSGEVEAGTAILLTDHGFLNYCEEELAGCLRPESVGTDLLSDRAERAERRLAELGRKAEQRGGRHMGAVWILPVKTV